MITLEELRRDLEITPKEREDVAKELKESEVFNSCYGVSVLSDYAFECVCCRSLNLDPFYIIIKGEFGPLDSNRKTKPENIVSIDGIIRLDDLDFDPENSSTLNLSPDGYVCDHCYDSVYSEDQAESQDDFQLIIKK